MSYNGGNSLVENALAFIGGLLIGFIPLIHLLIIIVCVCTSGGNAGSWFLKGVFAAFLIDAIAAIIIFIIVMNAH